MPFTLRLELSGPILYIVDTPVNTITHRPAEDGEIEEIHTQTADRVGVVMPDCRRPDDGKERRHLDDHPAVPHAGCLLLNLGDIDRSLPRGDEQKGPKYELVHRFTGQVLRIAGTGTATQIDTTRLHVPNFDLIAPRLPPRGDLFASPAPDVLMRMVLEGGRLESDPKVPFKLSDVLNPGTVPGQNDHEGRFASSITWVREFEGDDLTATVTDIGATNPEATFLMQNIPENGVVRMRVANACAFNPLEWPELPPAGHTFMDEDFKWLYRLLADVPRVAVLPCPVVDLSAANGETGDEGCMGGRITGPLP